MLFRWRSAHSLMIHAVLIFLVNTSGTPRLIKFYSPLRSPSQPLIQKIFSLVSARPPGLCNFLDAPDLRESLSGEQTKGDDVRVVYRNYATLYFVLVVDGAESELGILDLIQVLVESLDRAFESVCELDLVFHFEDVHYILSQVIQGGLVLDTNVDDISVAVQDAMKARKSSFASSNPLALGSGGPGPKTSSLQTPMGWITGKLTGIGAK